MLSILGGYALWVLFWTIMSNLFDSETFLGAFFLFIGWAPVFALFYFVSTLKFKFDEMVKNGT